MRPPAQRSALSMRYAPTILCMNGILLNQTMNQKRRTTGWALQSCDRAGSREGLRRGGKCCQAMRAAGRARCCMLGLPRPSSNHIDVDSPVYEPQAAGRAAGCERGTLVARSCCTVNISGFRRLLAADVLNIARPFTNFGQTGPSLGVASDTPPLRSGWLRRTGPACFPTSTSHYRQLEQRTLISSRRTPRRQRWAAPWRSRSCVASWLCIACSLEVSVGPFA